MKNYKFPFFGEGEATYFGFVGLNIRFQVAPNPEQVAAIIEALPMEYGATTDDFEGKWSNFYSEFGYGHIDIAIPDVDGFNQEIREAVVAVNEICPIQFVFREEDHESDGTDFNEWHQESEETLISTIEDIEAELPTLSIEDVENLKEYFERILTMYEMETNRLESLVWNPIFKIIEEL